MCSPYPSSIPRSSARSRSFCCALTFSRSPRRWKKRPSLTALIAGRSFTECSLPLVSPGILTVALISGLNTWNEFLISSTFLQSHDQQTAVVRFYTLGGQYSSDWGEIMAAAILIVAPVRRSYSC